MWFREKNRNKGEESDKALEEAETNLARAEERSVEVTEVAEALRDLRRQNHFAEALEAIIVIRPKGKRT